MCELLWKILYLENGSIIAYDKLRDIGTHSFRNEPGNIESGPYDLKGVDKGEILHATPCFLPAPP